MIRSLRRIALGVLAAGILAGLTPSSPSFADDIPEIRADEGAEPLNYDKLYEQFERFDINFAYRRQEVTVPAHEWIAVANKLSEFTEARMALSRPEGGAIAVRAVLIKGECHLFASVEYFKNHDHRFLEQYRRGLEHLVWVIHATGGPDWIDPDIETLPAYSSMRAPGDARSRHQWAGIETIGTGIGEGFRDTRGTGVVHRRVTYLPGPYTSLKDYREIVGGGPGNVRQLPSSQTARELLSAFCPWGIDVYLGLEEAGLTDHLDYRILEPFWGKDPSTFDRLIEVVGTEATAAAEWLLGTGDGSVAYDVQPPVSIATLEDERVPPRILRAMQRIAGSSTGADPRPGAPAPAAGALGALGTRSVSWRWVGQPTYQIWTTSPAIFDWQPSDYLWLSFTVVKVVFGGPGGVIADEFLGKLASHVASAYGDGPSNVPVLTNMVMQQYDKGFLMPSVIEKQEWLSAAAVTRKIATSVLAAAEKQMLHDLYQGIDMKNHSLGTTYDGAKIPPVLIRGSVLGFPEVADDKYPSTHEAVRFFLVYPELDGRAPLQKYDLWDSTLPLDFDSLGWWLLPDPLGTIDIVNSFAPVTQTIVFRLAGQSAAVVSSRDGLRAELWTISSGSERRYAATAIGGGGETYALTLFNENHPTGRARYAEHVRAGDPVGMAGGSADAETMEAIGRALSAKYRARGANDYLDALVPLKTQYRIRIVAKGELLAEVPVILDRGTDRSRAITGRLTTTDDGGVVLELEPPIEIVKLEVAPPKVVAGDAGSGR